MQKELNNKCKILRCQEFNYHKFYYNKALPKHIKNIDLKLLKDSNNTFIGKKITTYLDSKKPTDSITTTVKWNLDLETQIVHFSSKISKLNTRYKFVEIDKFYLILARDTSKK